MKRSIAYAAVLWGAATVGLSYGTGALPGLTGANGTVPLEVTRDLSATNGSCGECHNVFPGGGAVPLRVRVAVSRRALQPNESVTVTTSATGGQVTTPPLVAVGGFCTDATAGTFTAGTNSQVDPNLTAITHLIASNSNNRTWTYGYTAPAQPGPVSLYSVVNTGDGDGQPGADVWGFHGYVGSSIRSTPVRLYVLARGVVWAGGGCEDGYGNHGVLGARQSPTVGNAAFALELIGARPSSLAFFLAAFNPPGFPSMDLGPLGLPGCSSHLSNPVSNTFTTSAGDLLLAEGTATMALPVPNSAGLRGVVLHAQACWIDPAAATNLGRALPLTVSNAIAITVQ